MWLVAAGRKVVTIVARQRGHLSVTSGGHEALVTRQGECSGSVSASGVLVTSSAVGAVTSHGSLHGERRLSRAGVHGESQDWTCQEVLK